MRATSSEGIVEVLPRDPDSVRDLESARILLREQAALFAAMGERFEQMQRELDRRTGEAEARARELRAVSAQLTHAEQRERRRLAELLHDQLQQLLVAAKMRVGLVRAEVADAEQRRTLSETEDLLKQCLHATRSLAVELSPPVLQDQGLTPALEWLARWMRDCHGLRVEVEGDGDAEPDADAIRVLLFEIVRELLLNVVKHARTECAEIQVSRFDDLVQVIVRDAGIGFDAAMLGAEGQTAGGFGLSNVRHRLELMGGQFDLESAPGAGTRVLLRAPASLGLDAGRASAHRPRSTGQPSPHRKRVRVLLADDHRMVREGLVALLGRYEEIDLVGEASDGRMVVDLARRLRPEVVVMDVSMPQMSGIEATRIIAAELPAVRIVGLSFHDEEDMAQAMLAAGAAAYLTKDRLSDDLVDLIQSVRGAKGDE
ncbi:MAG: response regulator [Planctomycetales bacterium]